MIDLSFVANIAGIITDILAKIKMVIPAQILGIPQAVILLALAFAAGFYADKVLNKMVWVLAAIAMFLLFVKL
jgi:nicotinamide riboside transporter PnuC